MIATPPDVRDGIKYKLWALCDDLGWMSLADTERARHYERWTRDQEIGGLLGHFMDPRKVRVYIKDSLIKPYVRERLASNESEVWRLLGLPHDEKPVHEFIKPHGRRLKDGRVIGWGRSRDWKSILMAVFERGRSHETFSPHGVILFESGKTESDVTRELVRDAARRLGIEKISWLE